MYTEFYNLREKPFNLTPSPRFLYLGESHREALNLLKYGVMERKGFILLTGDIGTGKTTMIQALLSTVDDSVHCIHLSNPLLSPGEFMDYLVFSAFNKKLHFKSKAEFLIEFEEFLRQCLRNQTNAILIIDEAQRLSFELLEEIRLLSNMETGDEKLINIFLVGQPELNEKLSKPQCLPLLQRISVRYHIPPLDLKGTRGYMATRLRIAGAPKGHEIFSKSAVEAIHHYSRGYPRVINTLGDNALLLGYSRGTKAISPHMVKQCYEDMSLESSFPRDGRKMPERYETRKIERTLGRYWKRAAVLCFFIALVAFGMTQRGRSFLRQLFALKQASYQSTSDTHTPAQILMEKEEILETDDSAGKNQMGVQSPPGMQPEQKGTETIEIGKPGGSMERMSTLQQQDKGSFKAVVVEEGVMCRDVLHRRPLVVGNSFKASVGKLYCFTKIVGAQSPIEITHVWYFGNSKMAKINLPVKSSSWRTYSSKTIHTQDIGHWHVEVLGPEGSVLWSVQFKITP